MIPMSQSPSILNAVFVLAPKSGPLDPQCHSHPRSPTPWPHPNQEATVTLQTMAKPQRHGHTLAMDALEQPQRHGHPRAPMRSLSNHKATVALQAQRHDCPLTPTPQSLSNHKATIATAVASIPNATVTLEPQRHGRTRTKKPRRP